MLGLFGGDADLVGVIGLRQAAKAGGMIKSQIDRRKLDVHDGVEQAGPTVRRDRAAIRYVFVRQQFRFGWPAANEGDRCGVMPIELASPPVGSDCYGQPDFWANFGSGQDFREADEKRLHQGAGLV